MEYKTQGALGFPAIVAITLLLPSNSNAQPALPDLFAGSDTVVTAPMQTSLAPYVPFAFEYQKVLADAVGADAPPDVGDFVYMAQTPPAAVEEEWKRVSVSPVFKAWWEDPATQQALDTLYAMAAETDNPLKLMSGEQFKEGFLVMRMANPDSDFLNTLGAAKDDKTRQMCIFWLTCSPRRKPPSPAIGNKNLDLFFPIVDGARP